MTENSIPDWLLSEAPSESIPLGPNGEENDINSDTTEGRSLRAAHRILDELGVPRTRVLNTEETVGGKETKHIMRVHGRLRLLKEALAAKGITDLFPKERVDVDPGDYLIWWLSQEACEQIGDLPQPIWPVYIQEEFMDRWGRAGRGRLFIHKDMRHFNLQVDESHFQTNNPLIRAIDEECGGIVIRREDGLIISSYPGFITDFSLQIWQPETSK